MAWQVEVRKGKKKKKVCVSKQNKKKSIKRILDWVSGRLTLGLGFGINCLAVLDLSGVRLTYVYEEEVGQNDLEDPFGPDMFGYKSLPRFFFCPWVKPH